ncbi:UNKNOWN [Stylonychia lemnae]|uniref:Uncharacterized protein n=1 Tax=Stylonychia lemnae TaxID=5949 RepID=A0A078AND0_STYLE|nr:UNKNOWN [Stylonychia lemnae]|eukprot:CDW82847.1 UNKNOWN [Stylonychia lemnae]
MVKRRKTLNSLKKGLLSSQKSRENLTMLNESTSLTNKILKLKQIENAGNTLIIKDDIINRDENHAEHQDTLEDEDQEDGNLNDSQQELDDLWFEKEFRKHYKITHEDINIKMTKLFQNWLVQKKKQMKISEVKKYDPQYLVSDKYLTLLRQNNSRYFEAFNQVNRNNYVFKEMSRKYKKKQNSDQFQIKSDSKIQGSASTSQLLNNQNPNLRSIIDLIIGKREENPVKLTSQKKINKRLLEIMKLKDINNDKRNNKMSIEKQREEMIKKTREQNFFQISQTQDQLYDDIIQIKREQRKAKSKPRTQYQEYFIQTIPKSENVPKVSIND